MTLPAAVVAASTMVYSMVFPDGNGGSPRSSQQVVSTGSSRDGSSGTFFYGMFFGMGLSSLISHELRRRRVLERWRVKFFSWLYENEDVSEDEKLPNKFRKPVMVEGVKGTPLHTHNTSGEEENEEDSCGVRWELVSPDWAFTSSLSVTILSLSFGAELVAKNAEGAEFYYVIKGEGEFKDGKESMKLSTGMAVLVDPGCERGFATSGRGDFVLLRATDTPLVGGGNDVMARLEASSMSSTAAILTAGLSKIETMVKSYTKKEKVKNQSVVVARDDWTPVDETDSAK